MGENGVGIKKPLSDQIMDDVLAELEGKEGYTLELIAKFHRLIDSGYVTSADQIIRLFMTATGVPNENT